MTDDEDTNPAPPKRPPGRPTIYRVEMCDKVIEFGREGYGRLEITAGLGVALSTMQLWEKVHPEFADAMAEAAEWSQAWWAAQGRLGIWGGGKFNERAYRFQMTNRFRDFWTDRKELQVPGGVHVHISSDDGKL